MAARRPTSCILSSQLLWVRRSTCCSFTSVMPFGNRAALAASRSSGCITSCDASAADDGIMPTGACVGVRVDNAGDA